VNPRCVSTSCGIFIKCVAALIGPKSSGAGDDLIWCSTAIDGGRMSARTTRLDRVLARVTIFPVDLRSARDRQHRRASDVGSRNHERPEGHSHYRGVKTPDSRPTLLRSADTGGPRATTPPADSEGVFQIALVCADAINLTLARTGHRKP